MSYLVIIENIFLKGAHFTLKFEKKSTYIIFPPSILSCDLIKMKRNTIFKVDFNK